MPSQPVQRDPSRPGADHERIGVRDVGDWRTAGGRALVTTVVHAATLVGDLLRWSAANLVLVGTAVLGGLVILGLNWAAGEVYEAVTENDGLAALDQPVLDGAIRLRSPGLDTAVTGFTNLGGTIGMPVLATVLTVGVALLWRRWTPVTLMLIATAGSLTMTTLGKELVGRTRPPASLAVPPLETSPSFPSGHTLNATVVMGVAAYLLIVHWAQRWARVATVAVAACFAVAMGLSRVFLGHHWLTDVIAGWLLGLAWVATVVTAHRLRVTVRRALPGPPAQNAPWPR
jgi:undecaprenyl-diphosphatase